MPAVTAASAAILASYHDSAIAEEHEGILTPTMNAAVVSTNSTNSIAEDDERMMQLLFAILNEQSHSAKVTQAGGMQLAQFRVGGIWVCTSVLEHVRDGG